MTERLSEYADNPFIARLPPPLSVAEALDALTELPSYDPTERGYAAHLRCHCIQRLARYFDPMNRHLVLEQRIGALIRQGYIGRNPHTTDFIHRLHNNHERMIQRNLDAVLHPVETTASGFALIGVSGIGKSRSIDRILRPYPQTIFHEDPMALMQVSWLKLDCPHKGSAKQLCISFFAEMDRLLRINAFAELSEPVVLLWVKGIERRATGDWYVTATLRGLNTKTAYSTSVPFGLMPCMIPGRVFNDGRMSIRPEIGQVDHATITALRQFEDVTLGDVPASVFPQGRKWKSDQPLFLHHTPEMDIYVPPAEMVRYLFLHDRVLANAILRRSALNELWVPTRPDFYRDLMIDFTSAMPANILTKKFVADFAWLALHPSGAKSWRSVAERSSIQSGLLLEPPKIENSRMALPG